MVSFEILWTIPVAVFQRTSEKARRSIPKHHGVIKINSKAWQIPEGGIHRHQKGNRGMCLGLGMRRFM